MGRMDSLLLKSKFRGSVLGTLMGDCLGSAYEGDEIFTAGMKLVIQRSFDKLEGPHFKAPVIQFTDDSAMTYAVAESLIERQGFDQKDMAKKFVQTFYKEPNRGYGAGVTTVFQKLRNNKFVDVLGPAREQFNGEGSLGNGGAMRVAPVALFCYQNYELMVDVARKQSQITHTHKTGVDGAILQAIAIHQSLLLDPKEKLNTCKFTDDLIEEMDKIEIDEEGLGLVNPSPYKTQLKLVRDLICEEGDGPHDEKVVHHLGNDVSALYSVPTAIYCFLKAQKPIKDVQTENPLRRTIQYADIPAYADNLARHSAYRSIHQALKIPNVTFTDVMMKISEIRRSYINQLRKVLTVQAAGYKHEPIPNWFNVIHEFLFPYLDCNESAALHKIGCSVSKSMTQDNTRKLAAGDPRLEEYYSDCEELRIEKIFLLPLKEKSSPVDFCLPRNSENHPDSFCLSRHIVSPLSDGSENLSTRFKYRSPSQFRMNIPRNMHSLQFPDINCPANTEVQFVLSSDSILSVRSSSTIVCDDKRSDYTSTSVKSFTEFGVQWDGLDSEKQSSSVYCNTSSVGNNGAKDSTVEIEYDEHDIFAQTIACYLKAMDIETALRAQNQIRKVINDHRLHKPETISLGGDTDTIGSMAGAIAGAFYGEELIRQEILNHCELSSEFRSIADQLFDFASA